MKWLKLGKIFAPNSDINWMLSHAAMPILHQSTENIGKLYFTTRDRHNRSHTAFLELDLSDPFRILRVSTAPILAPGDDGYFDDSGSMASSIVECPGVLRLYYVGWNLGVSVPFRHAIGLAESRDGGESFSRFSTGPILDRSIWDPCFPSGHSVLFKNGKWRMWYVSCTHWRVVNGQKRHYYHVKYAESNDGINWQRDGIVCLDFANEDEYAFGRPCVIEDHNGYKMWYCVRGQAYKLGYAESVDGLRWERKDTLAGLETSPGSWDSEMIAYPYVYSFKGNQFMFYNGNDYGQTGVGLAILE